MQSDKTNETTICIVGAGLAGLTAAYDLVKNKKELGENFKIEVVEAAPRVGGRVHTLHFSEGLLYAEAGAMGFGDNETDIINLADELGVEIVKHHDLGGQRYFVNGAWDADFFNNVMIVVMGKLFEKIQELEDNKTIEKDKDWSSNEPTKSIALDKLDNISIIDFLNQELPDFDEEKITLAAQMSLLGMYTNEIQKLSAFAALHFMSQYKNTNYINAFKGGNDQLPNALYRKLIESGVEFKLNTPVQHIKKITHDGAPKSQVTVQTETGQKEVFEYDYMIVATPLTMLQENKDNHIEFEPPLPQQKNINETPINNTISRVYSEVGRKFWKQNKQDPTTAKVITDQTTLYIEDHTQHLNEEGGVIEAHSSGSVGAAVCQSENPKEEGIKQITHIYGELFQQHRIGAPKSILWGKQPYQQGAYPYLSLGQRSHLAKFRQNDGRTYFAGEHTTPGHPGSMNGAVTSGHQAAKKVIKAIKANNIGHQETQSSAPSLNTLVRLTP